MATNTSPVFPCLGDLQWIICGATTNTTTDLTAGTNYLAYTAPSGSGGYVIKLKFRALGTNAVTVGRIWINNGSTTGTAANNTLYNEITLPATTVSQVAALTDQEMPLGIKLPAGYKIYLTFGTGVAAGFNATTVTESLVSA